MAGSCGRRCVNKAGRPQYHWETMDEVREGDVVLHYSNGSLRAASHVSAAARPAANPLGDQSWEEAGRLVETQYQELNEPVALAAIDEGARIRQGAPFTVTGSVQQVYLVRLQETSSTNSPSSSPSSRRTYLRFQPLRVQPQHRWRRRRRTTCSVTLPTQWKPLDSASQQARTSFDRS